MTKFLENKFGKDHEVNRFMYSFGAVIAVACTLMVTDAHLENIVVDQGIPVLVDPECMPYPVFSASPQIRLFRTGLVSNDANYSALLGGGRSMRNSRGQVSEGGVFSYLHQSKNLRNRFIFSNGSEADPREFKRDIIMGFSDAYQVLLSNIGDINEIMGRYLTQDYRTRIVVRATRHYTSILEMLKLPQVQDYRTWKSAVLEKFAKSGSYIGTTTQMIHAEISDLEIGDVPFFWFNMRDRRLHHRNGIISDLRPEAFNSTQRDFYCNIKEDEHDVLIDCLTAFLAEN